MLCKCRAAMSHFVFSCEMKISMESARRCCRPKPRQSQALRSIFLSVIGLWVEIRQRNKTTCSESNPVQSSRSNASKLEALVEVGILDFDATVDCKCQERTQFWKNSQEDLTLFAKCWIFSSNFWIELVSTNRTLKKNLLISIVEYRTQQPETAASFYLIWKTEHSH